MVLSAKLTARATAFVAGSMCLMGAHVAWPQATAAPGEPEPPAVFVNQCAACHGPTGKGGAQAPALLSTFSRHGTDDASLTRSIKHGYPEAGMPAFGEILSDKDIAEIIAFAKATSKFIVAGIPVKFPPATLPQGVVRTEVESFRIETVANLDGPMGLAFLPDGRILVTQANGSLRIIEKGKLLPQAVIGTPKGAKPPGDFARRALLDVALHPDYRTNGWIYITYSEGTEGTSPFNSNLVVLARGRLKDGRWIGNQVLLKALSDSSAGRIAFDGKGYVYMTTADASFGNPAAPETSPHQSLSNASGKVLRAHDDGRVPKDNPFVGRKDAFPYIWSYGHRVPLGLTFGADGRLWETEDGPRGGDEMNLIQPGRNYGWPVITWGHRYDQQAVPARPTAEGMEQPVVSWVPSPAVSVAHLYTGAAFPRWKNNIFVGTLKARSLFRIVVDGDRATVQETVFQGVDRIRDIKTGLDGLLYMVTDSGLLLRLAPASP